MAPTIVDQLKAALAHHQAGRTAEARTLYDAGPDPSPRHCRRAASPRRARAARG
ncbi:MAG: hypothetical protein WDO24_16205 [Pseudomonadota bacterium]